jgi:proteic killer suppression protein
VIQSFADDATKDIFDGLRTKAARSVPSAIWPVARRKLDQINRVTRLELLGEPPGNRLEALKGERAGAFSIRVNDQYRITFRFQNGDAYEVRCEDYHR